MPSLKQLSCHIEWTDPQTQLREYATTYSDGVVESYVAVPPDSTPFSIRLRSDGYIAPGLAMFVYMDGVYQCNRNRQGLKLPSEATEKSDTEVNFHLCQREQRLRDGTWVGKEWQFEKLNIVSGNEDHFKDVEEDTFDHLGTIEVVVLRCQAVSEDERTGKDSPSPTAGTTPKPRHTRKQRQKSSRRSPHATGSATYKSASQNSTLGAASKTRRPNPPRWGGSPNPAPPMMGDLFDGPDEVRGRRSRRVHFGGDGSWDEPGQFNPGQQWGYSVPGPNTGYYHPRADPYGPRVYRPHPHHETHPPPTNNFPQSHSGWEQPGFHRQSPQPQQGVFFDQSASAQYGAFAGHTWPPYSQPRPGALPSPANQGLHGGHLPVASSPPAVIINLGTGTYHPSRGAVYPNWDHDERRDKLAGSGDGGSRSGLESNVSDTAGAQDRRSGSESRQSRQGSASGGGDHPWKETWEDNKEDRPSGKPSQDDSHDRGWPAPSPEAQTEQWWISEGNGDSGVSGISEIPTWGGEEATSADHREQREPEPNAWDAGSHASRKSQKARWSKNDSPPNGRKRSGSRHRFNKAENRSQGSRRDSSQDGNSNTESAPWVGTTWTWNDVTNNGEASAKDEGEKTDDHKEPDACGDDAWAWAGAFNNVESHAQDETPRETSESSRWRRPSISTASNSSSATAKPSSHTAGGAAAVPAAPEATDTTPRSTSGTIPPFKPYRSSWLRFSTGTVHPPPPPTPQPQTTTSSHSSRSYLAPDPAYAVPEEIARKTASSHQVRPRKGVRCRHRSYRPVYMDSMERPYAVFVFRYLAQDRLERLLGVTVGGAEGGEGEKERLEKEVGWEGLRAKSAKVGDAGADEGRIDEASGEGNAAEDVQW